MKKDSVTSRVHLNVCKTVDKTVDQVDSDSKKKRKRVNDDDEEKKEGEEDEEKVNEKPKKVLKKTTVTIADPSIISVPPCSICFSVKCTAFMTLINSTISDDNNSTSSAETTGTVCYKSKNPPLSSASSSSSSLTQASDFENAWMSSSFPYVADDVMKIVVSRYPSIKKTSGSFTSMVGNVNGDNIERQVLWSSVVHYFCYHTFAMIDQEYADAELLSKKHAFFIKKSCEKEAYVKWKMNKAKKDEADRNAENAEKKGEKKLVTIKLSTARDIESFYGRKLEKISLCQRFKIMTAAYIKMFSYNTELAALLLTLTFGKKISCQDVDNYQQSSRSSQTLAPAQSSLLSKFHIDYLCGKAIETARDFLLQDSSSKDDSEKDEGKKE